MQASRLQAPRLPPQVLLTAGTILHGSHKPLLSWFRAAFAVAQFGFNARKLQKYIKLTYKIAWTWCHKLRRAMCGKTTLDAPFPPFDRAERERRGLPTNAIAEEWYFETHGNYRWGFQRESGLGTCCQRLTKIDWDIRRQPLLYPNLFRDYSGSLSDKHLRAYFDESEFRWNHRQLDLYDAVTSLIARFLETPPFPYRAIVGPLADRSPLYAHRVVEPFTIETVIRRSREQQSRERQSRS